MAKKTAWHTDIVVDGKGLGLKISPQRSGCYRVGLEADTPGKAAEKAKKKFLKSAKAEGVCFPTAKAAKSGVERGIISSQASWNKWHREAY